MLVQCHELEILGSKNAFYLSHQIPTQTILLKATNSKLIFGLQEEVYFFEVLGEKNVGTRAIYPDVGYILIYSTSVYRGRHQNEAPWGK